MLALLNREDSLKRPEVEVNCSCVQWLRITDSLYKGHCTHWSWIYMDREGTRTYQYRINNFKVHPREMVLYKHQLNTLVDGHALQKLYTHFWLKCIESWIIYLHFSLYLKRDKFNLIYWYFIACEACLYNEKLRKTTMYSLKL